MEDPHTLGYLFADLIYLLLTIVATVLFILYLHAWKKMKHSPMIRSVWILMLAIAIDSFIWTITTIAHIYYEPLEDLMLEPIWLILTKLIFLLGMVTFLWATLSPSDDTSKKVTDIQHASNITTLPVRRKRRR